MHTQPDADDATKDAMDKIIAFVLPTAEDEQAKLSVLDVFRKKIHVSTRYPLLPIDPIKEEDMGIFLTKTLRSTFNHLMNLSRALEESAEKLKRASAEFESKKSVPGSDPARMPEAELRKARRLLSKWSDELNSDTLRVAQEEADFFELVIEQMPDLNGKIVFIRTGYRISELTLPSDLSWLDLIPEKNRKLTACRLFHEGTSPYDIGRDEIEASLQSTEPKPEFPKHASGLSVFSSSSKPPNDVIVYFRPRA